MITPQEIMQNVGKWEREHPEEMKEARASHTQNNGKEDASNEEIKENESPIIKN